MSPCRNRQFYKLLKLFRARSLVIMNAVLHISAELTIFTPKYRRTTQ